MRTQAQFLHTIEHHAQVVGFAAPQDLQWYLAVLLADHLRDPDLVPGSSYAEQYFLAAQHRDPVQFRRLADTLLLAVSVMPELGRRRGIAVSYYQGLAQVSYRIWADRTQDLRGYQLSEWFPYLRQFPETLFGNGRQQLDLFDPWTR